MKSRDLQAAIKAAGTVYGVVQTGVKPVRVKLHKSCLLLALETSFADHEETGAHLVAETNGNCYLAVETKYAS